VTQIVKMGRKKWFPSHTPVISNPLFASMDVLFKRKDVSGYPWFGSRDVQGSEGEDIHVNNKYLLPSK